MSGWVMFLWLDLIKTMMKEDQRICIYPFIPSPLDWHSKYSLSQTIEWNEHSFLLFSRS